MAMDRSSMSVLLILCACWCAHQVGAQFPLSTAIIIPTEAKPIEGDTVVLQCNVTGLLITENYEIDWWIFTDFWDMLTQNGRSLYQRYAISTTEHSPDLTVSLLTISNVTRDEGNYSCDLLHNNTMWTENIHFDVLYFPVDQYPICAPSGSYAVRQGATLAMNCTTENGNPPAQVEVRPPSIEGVIWKNTTGVNIQILSSSLSVNDDHQNVTFMCNVTSPSTFPGRESSCIIGPLDILSAMVPGVITQADASSTVEPLQTSGSPTEPGRASPLMTGGPEEPPVAWIAVTVVVFILFIVSMLFNVFFIITRCRQGSSKTDDPSPPDIELQKPGKDADGYVTPIVEDTTDEAVYQTVLETKEDEQKFVVTEEEYTDVAADEEYTDVVVDKDTGQKDGKTTQDEQDYQNVKSKN